MIGSDKMAEIPLELESAGILKMFALYPKLQEVLENGCNNSCSGSNNNNY